MAETDRAAELTRRLLEMAKTPKDRAAIAAKAAAVEAERLRLIAAVDVKLTALLGLMEDLDKPAIELRAVVALRQLRGAHQRLLEHVAADEHELAALDEAKAKPVSVARSVLRKGLPDALLRKLPKGN